VNQIGPALLHHSFTFATFLILCLAASGRAAGPLAEAQVPVEEIRLANGFKLLLVEQPESTTVVAGWMVGVGSADDPSNRTGLSHLLEHMMFKGTRTVGARDLVQELETLAEVDRIWHEEQALELKIESASARKRQKLTQQLAGLVAERQSLQEKARSQAFLGLYSFLYSEQGGTDLNANTYRDLTAYYVTLPTEKLELWFWMESDRLTAPIFREFYKELGVIHEERRLRIDATPTGGLDEQLRGLFWGDHPYSWNPMGRPGDLDRIRREEAAGFFRRHYRADNMTAVLVGGFDRELAKLWARRYFGRLQSGSPAKSAAIRSGPPPRAQKRSFTDICNCPPQVQVLYPTAAFGHPDTYPLQLLSAIMNGRTGRLYRSLVLDQQIAFSAYSQQISWRQAGEFSFRAESKGVIDPEALIVAWDQQLDRLLSEAPTTAEIRRAKNRLAADAFRRLQEPAGLMKQLLIYEGLGDWRYVNRWPSRIQELTAQDLVRAAAEYLKPASRTIAIYRRPETKTGTSPGAP